MTKHNNYLVILAGGAGKRLWPISRQRLPKQFLDLSGTGRTLLQQTYDRFSEFIDPERIYVSTFDDYADEVLRQLPLVNPEHVLSEPVQLSTAPAAAWATLHVEQFDPEANIIVTPADHKITDLQRFRNAIEKGLQYVETHGDFLSIAARPTSPNTTYGYIQKGECVCGEDGLFCVKSFSEKPDIDFAKLFVESGEFVWNTGLFMWAVPTMVKQLDRLMPDMADRWHEEKRVLAFDEEQALIREFYPASLRLSVDLLILEKSENGVCVQECDFGWVDIGSWSGIYEASTHDADSNVVLSGQTILSGSSGNIISLPNGNLVCIRGLKDYVVAEKDGVLVICPREEADTFRLFRNEAQVQEGEEFV